MTRMRLQQALWTAGIVTVCVGVSSDLLARPKSVPFPDRNPKRIASQTEAPSAGQAAVTAIAPKPSGPVTKLPELLKYSLSDSDAAAVKSAIRSIYSRKFSAARSSIGTIKGETAVKLAWWYYYRRSKNDADPNKIEQFRLANPDWPSERRLQRNAEEALLRTKHKPEAILTFFGDKSPTTGAGKAALAGAYLAQGNQDKAKSLIRIAWRKHTLGADLEKIILAQFGKLLESHDHKARVDRLLLLDRKSKIAAVKRTAALLDKKENKKIDARIAVVQRSKKAKALLAAIPDDDIKEDIGFYFSRIQWLRRHKQEEKAWKLLLAAPKDPKELIAIDEWWIERRVNCRQALNAGHPEIAYRIARDHEPISGKHYREAEFLAGWLALRHLNKPNDAREHFQALRTAATDPDEIAEAEYWLGRTANDLHQAEEALKHFKTASATPLSYYGQLALQSIKAGPTDLPLPAAPAPTENDLRNFRERDAVKAIGLINSINLEKLVPLFFHQLARTIQQPGEAVLLAKLAEVMDQPHASVRLSKIALNRGLPMAEFAYPTNLLPEYKEINVPVEQALLYSLSRQESEFNPSAKSPVGARGLMQIMPRTARAIARQHKVRYRRADLTKKPEYNVMLGVAHLGDLLEDYNDSYILTLVAYNAGGGRVRNWTKEFGDPRTADVDAIDWVERIPFTETRNYVKKILTGVQIFRARLQGNSGALRLTEDLNRGKTAQRN